MIPKVIHYCWFGKGPMPRLAEKCIISWKKNLPDYKIIEWNESNFDINICSYTKEAYEAKKYAFVSDYARFWILYHYGGIYLDTDVEVIKSFDPIISTGPFMGCEAKNKEDVWPQVASGLGIGADKYHPIYKEILDHYNSSSFLLKDGSYDYTTVVNRVSEILKKHGLQPKESLQVCDDIIIYPPEFFSPKSHITREIIITPNTYSIHHYDGSWMKKNNRLLWCEKILGPKITEKIRRLFIQIKRVK